jgi:hypothetical protein
MRGLELAADPWIAAVRKALLDRGVGYTDDGKCVLLPDYGGTDQPPQAAIDVYNARKEFSRVYPTQKRHYAGFEARLNTSFGQRAPSCSDGHYDDGNLKVVCRFVNRRKGDTPDEKFRRLLTLGAARG